MEIIPSSLDETWIVNFYDHKPLTFSSKEDMEKYLCGECSESYGYMEYERVPEYILCEKYYNINYANEK